MDQLLPLVIGLAIVAALVWGCYTLAVKKGRSGPLWGVLGFFFGIFALIVIALLPAQNRV